MKFLAPACLFILCLTLNILSYAQVANPAPIETEQDRASRKRISTIAAKDIQLDLDDATLDRLIEIQRSIRGDDAEAFPELAGEYMRSVMIDSVCWEARPQSIEDLTDGVLIASYSFEQGDEKKLGLLGFFNVRLRKTQKAIVIEYAQEGSQYCGGKLYKYGVGARMMMKVTQSAKGAKLNTPQQITASVIFGMAEVSYSLRTFGITGPGIGRLSKTGTLSEDTYQEFIQEISFLITEMYKDKSRFRVQPQPLFLKAQP